MRPDLISVSLIQTTATVPVPSEPSETTTSTTEVAVTGDAATGADTDTGGIGLGIVVVLCLLIAGLAGLAGWFVGSRRAAATDIAATGPTTIGPTTPQDRSEPPRPEVVDPDRKKLVDGIIAVRDLIDNPAVSDRLGQLLESVGITTIDPTGARFDPLEHQAQAPPTLVSDRALDGTIAQVISVGYSERGSITQFPVVVIYRYSENAE